MERRRKPRVLLPVVSVRTRLIAVITVVAALGLVAVGFVVYVEERQRILDQVDDLLEANLASARYLVEQGDGETLAWDDATAALAAVVQRAAPDDNTESSGSSTVSPASSRVCPSTSTCSRRPVSSTTSCARHRGPIPSSGPTPTTA